MTETLSLSPQAVAEWVPFAKAAGFFFATFILEDVAAIGAGLLLATGDISWPAAFAACFLGIWFGDAGLYGLARFAGRSWFERSSLRRFGSKVARSERWFAERGAPILIFSRMVPGARLPTYLAAGFLRVPLPRFLLITGAASCAWTFAVLFLARTFGVRLVHWLNAYKHAGVWALTGGVVALALLQLLRRALMNFDLRRVTAWLARWGHWEFWPAWMFYPPVAVYCLWLAIKYRGLTLPTAANPGIFSGGFVGESKMATLKDLMAGSPEFTAEAELLAGASGVEERLELLRKVCGRQAIAFPFILKPDVGQRGVGIKLIRGEADAIAYLKQTSAPLVAQRYVEGPHEIGIFYSRFPGDERGSVFAITEKVFPVVMGDGRSTLAELIWRDPRARLIAGKYLARFAAQRDKILPAGESFKLVEAGNHAQGCIFRDGMNLCTPALAERIDEISRKVPGFYIGRFDIRYGDEADLQAGRNFKIIELNGAASEATSIYDARNSLRSAYRQLFRQWDLVFAIGAVNRERGCAPTKLSLIWRKWREYVREAATYPAAD
jgi:membrane protein DedA with SNARE-associated domain